MARLQERHKKARVQLIRERGKTEGILIIIISNSSNNNNNAASYHKMRDRKSQGMKKKVK